MLTPIICFKRCVTTPLWQQVTLRGLSLIWLTEHEYGQTKQKTLLTLNFNKNIVVWIFLRLDPDFHRIEIIDIGTVSVGETGISISTQKYVLDSKLTNLKSSLRLMFSSISSCSLNASSSAFLPSWSSSRISSLSRATFRQTMIAYHYYPQCTVCYN